jgi:hypothetical protein
VVKSDSRLTVHQIASIIGISAASAFRNLKLTLQMRRFTVIWMPHLLLNKKKHVRLETSRKLLKVFPKYQRNQFSDIITGDNTWVLFFLAYQTIREKIWAIKNCCSTSIANRIINAKKAIICYFL